MCAYQRVNYTIIIEEDVDNAAVNTLLNGPYNHQGPGVVSHGIGGLKNDRTYSVRVQMDYITGNTESTKNYFGKINPKAKASIHVDNILTPKLCNYKR